MFDMISGLLSAGASILGGLFGGDDEPKTTTSYVDYSDMVRRAEAAGFNPLTAIRNGGSAGFTTSTTSGGGSTPLSRIAGALPGAIDTFMTKIDPFNDRTREMQYKIQEAQLANLQTDTAARSRVSVGGVPAVTGSRVSRPPVGSGVPHGKTSIPAASVITPAQVPGVAVDTKNPLEVKPPETDKPKRVNPYPSWTGLEINPWTSNASNWEDWFGDNELASMVGTVSQVGHDVVWNGYRGVGALSRGAERAKKFANKKIPTTRSEGWEDPRSFYPPPLSR